MISSPVSSLSLLLYEYYKSFEFIRLIALQYATQRIYFATLNLIYNTAIIFFKSMELSNFLTP